MKTTQAIRRVAGVLVVMASLNAYAQSNGETAAPAVSAASATNAKAANRALQKNVLRALSKTKGLNVTAITVRAKNGTVMLEGTVPEQTQIELATHAAQDVAGVSSVRNELTLAGPAGSQ
ncbi:BON domain-containing protein [Paraburkholderia sediminicola]|uniref:BON domain-containing protein n=1 Tax=Paraburkholderia TaxID=1822464 RepID=UPI0038B9551B